MADFHLRAGMTSAWDGRRLALAMTLEASAPAMAR
jgi:hypothetical protein